MLRILTGRAGSGKTAWTLARMKEEGTRRPQLLVVPEQASFEMEVRLCRTTAAARPGPMGGALLHPSG